MRYLNQKSVTISHLAILAWLAQYGSHLYLLHGTQKVHFIELNPQFAESYANFAHQAGTSSDVLLSRQTAGECTSIRLA